VFLLDGTPTLVSVWCDRAPRRARMGIHAVRGGHLCGLT